MLLVALAFALGFKHSYDADHLVAVANFLMRSKGLKTVLSMSISWAIGHMLTASIITLILYFLLSEAITLSLSYFEIGVGLMLITIGIFSIAWETKYFHTHFHFHGEKGHSHSHLHFIGQKLRRPFVKKLHLHPHLLGVGIIHGLASNDELFTIIVISLGVVTLSGLFLNLGIYSIGVVVGMVIFGIAVSYPVLRWGACKVRRTVNIALATFSIVYGALLLLGMETWNPFALFLS